jgi:hypothetical protein
LVKYDALNKEYGEKISAVAQDATLSKENSERKKNGFEKGKGSKSFLKFLTPDQQNKYRELVDKRKGNGKICKRQILRSDELWCNFFSSPGH